MSAVPLSSVPVAWQTRFLAVLPAVQTHAKIRFRRQPPHRREESVQETIAAACTSYQLLAARGQLDRARPGMLADFATRHVSGGRHVGGTQDLRNDLLSLTCRRHHGFRVGSLDAESQNATRCCLASGSRNVNVAELAAFRIDFSQWLAMQGRRHRRIIMLLGSGERTMAVAERFGLSPARVSQLRRRYEQGWRVFQGEIPEMARAG